MQLYNLAKVQLRDVGNSTEELFDRSLSFKKVDVEELQDTVKSLISRSKTEKMNISKKIDSGKKSETSDLENKDVNTTTELKDNSRKRTLTDSAESTNPSKKQLLDASTTLEKKSYPQVLFLGTGAAMPSKYRNVSATLLFFRYEDFQNFLLTYC